MPKGGERTETSREFLLHRFRPLTEEEQKRRDALIAAHARDTTFR
jgi:hypothetical protein